MKNNKAVAVRGGKDKTLARPLKVLIPLIKDDLKERKRVRDEASGWIEVRIGEELIEAKSQVDHGAWSGWVEKHFDLSYRTAMRWMQIARNVKVAAPGNFETPSEASGDRRKGSRMPAWGSYVRETVNLTREEQAEAQAKQEREDREEAIAEAELQAEIKLGNRLVDIGYRVLSTELHPDKKGGSKEAMQRLNVVRGKLRQSVKQFDSLALLLERTA
jgi:hypothetical protein